MKEVEVLMFYSLLLIHMIKLVHRLRMHLRSSRDDLCSCQYHCSVKQGRCRCRSSHLVGLRLGVGGVGRQERKRCLERLVGRLAGGIVLALQLGMRLQFGDLSGWVMGKSVCQMGRVSQSATVIQTKQMTHLNSPRRGTAEQRGTSESKMRSSPPPYSEVHCKCGAGTLGSLPPHSQRSSRLRKSNK